MDRLLIENLITKHEGKRASVYHDTVGKMTVGVGFNIDAPGAASICAMFGIDYAGLHLGTVTLTPSQIDEIFDYQLNKVIGQALTLLPTFNTMPDSVQAVVCDMIFNLGLNGFSQFKQMIAALEEGNWKLAATCASQSKWAMQTGNRAKDDIFLLESA